MGKDTSSEGMGEEDLDEEWWCLVTTSKQLADWVEQPPYSCGRIITGSLTSTQIVRRGRKVTTFHPIETRGNDLKQGVDVVDAALRSIQLLHIR